MVISMRRGRRNSQRARAAAKQSTSVGTSSSFVAGGPVDFTVRYAEACGLAAHGQYDKARRIYAELDAVLAGAESEAGVRALIRSDLAAIAALEGRFDEAFAG